MEWLSPKEHTPLHNQPVVIISKVGDHYFAKFNAESSTFDCNDGWFEYDDVNFWYPIPDVPEKKHEILKHEKGSYEAKQFALETCKRAIEAWVNCSPSEGMFLDALFTIDHALQKADD